MAQRRAGVLMAGCLIYLMGPSGSGKDTVLQGLGARLGRQDCYIAQRIVTRAADPSETDALSVSAEEFKQLEQRGALAMAWHAHGLAYGISRAIDTRLDAGCDVLVNGSRAYLPRARQDYPNLLAVLLTVKPEVLRQRLQARGRESDAEIELRLARNHSWQQPVSTDESEWNTEIFLIDNSGPVEHAIQSLTAFLRQARLCA
jgi:ribose 1,5-bisphosphokinase